MPIFVVFIFASIIFGAGAMLSPALPTSGPRIGLSGALTLAFITAGSIFYANLFGWNTLVIDYMWFTALVGIFFAGTMSAGMFRAEAAGGTKTYAGWPGPRELAFFLTAAILFIAPAMVLPVPLDTDAQGFGYLALALRQSGSMTTLAPYHPEISYLYSPAFPALIAYLSERLNAGIHILQISVGAVLCVLFVWVAYDLGNEIDPEREQGSRRMGVIMAFCALIGLGLMLAYLDSHFTALMGLVFALAFVTFVMRYHREGRFSDFLGAAITLAGVPLAQPDMTIILALGYVPWLVTLWFAEPRPKLREFLPRWLGLAVGIPLLAVVGVSPWLSTIAPLLGTDIRSPFEISVSHLIVILVYHGVVIVLLALGGIAIGLRRRNTLDLMMIVWLALVIDFSSVGIVKALAGPLLEPIFKYDYPFSIAWHGPIIPYLYLGATALAWLLRRGDRQRTEHWLRLASLPVMNAVALVAVLGIAYPQSILEFSKTMPFMMYGAFSSEADVAAMRWLAQNSRQDALVLNHPGPQEGDWVPSIAQRNTVYFRPQPFFRNTEQVEAMQDELRAFWRNPSDPANAALLARYGVDYVIVPQIVTRPESLTTMFRWRPPVPEAVSYRRVEDAPYLELVFERDGAQVWRVMDRSN